jgi:aspartyl-tRNA(Asn)/glutamyl-tRNA(Gln) amidotransferase subunit A
VSEDQVCWLSALELQERFRRRELSPVEVVEAVLGRIDRLNPSLNAYVTATPELAIEQARAAERAYAAGAAGPLAGVPISIKDLTPTRGVRTTRGSLMDPDWVPDFDAPFVERVYTAGAVLLGKTNTPELGWKGDSGNRVVGPSHNPWRHGLTPGGSSGGAGAAVAAGLGPLSQGSDGAGSIRIPAAFCGIFGHKPSFGLVPQFPASAVGDLSHLGPMTRTVRDAALLLDVVAGADPRDRLSHSTGVDHLAACEGGIAGLRVAWSPDLGYAAVEPAVREVVTVAAERFASDLGCHVEEVEPGIEDPYEILDTIWVSAMAGYMGDQYAARRPLLDPGLVREIDRARDFAMVRVAAAYQRRNNVYHAWRTFFQRWDLLITPMLSCTAFEAGRDHPGQVAGVPTTFLSWTPFSFPFNLTGQPAATVPCGFVDGLPVGLQIVGRWRDDATVLRAAAAFEAATPWAQYRPSILSEPVV